MRFESFKIPIVKDNLVEVSSVSVRRTEDFIILRKALVSEVEASGILCGIVQSDADLDALVSARQALVNLRLNIVASIRLAEEQVIAAQREIDQSHQELDSQIVQLLATADLEISRYSQQQKRAREEAKNITRLATEAAQKKLERQEQLMVLRGEVAAARQVADNAERFGEGQTAAEIRKGLQRFERLDSSPGSYLSPKKDAIEIRSIVALAMQHEQERRPIITVLRNI